MKVVEDKNGKLHLKWTKMDTLELVATIVSSIVGTVLGLLALGLI